MRKTHLFGKVAAGLACVGLFAPNAQVFAAGPQAAQTATATSSVDVALSGSGTLTGQYVSPQGEAIDGAAVTVRQNGQEAGRTTTNKDGVFSVANLRGGVYEVAVGSSSQTFRLWTANTAPPSAKPFATVVAGNAVRGQFGEDLLDTSTVQLLGFTALVITTAIIAHEVSQIAEEIDDLASP